MYPEKSEYGKLMMSLHAMCTIFPAATEEEKPKQYLTGAMITTTPLPLREVLFPDLNTCGSGGLHRKKRDVKGTEYCAAYWSSSCI